MFNFLKQRKNYRILMNNAHSLYVKTAVHCRDPIFYTHYNIPDTVEGRFDLIVLHLFLLMRYMGGDSDEAQALFDAFFKDMDRTMREAGVGDLAVPKRIKKLMQSFYGRYGAYEDAFDESNAAVTKAIARNVYGDDGAKESANNLTDYIAYNRDRLDETPSNTIPLAFTFQFKAEGAHAK